MSGCLEGPRYSVVFDCEPRVPREALHGLPRQGDAIEGSTCGAWAAPFPPCFHDFCRGFSATHTAIFIENCFRCRFKSRPETRGWSIGDTTSSQTYIGHRPTCSFALHADSIVSWAVCGVQGTGFNVPGCAEFDGQTELALAILADA